MSPYESPPTKPWRRRYDYASEAILGFARAYPATLSQLVEDIRAGEASGPNPKIRAAGSHWSFSDAAVTNGWQIETSDPDRPPHAWHQAGGLNRVLYDVVPDCLSGPAMAFMRAQAVPAFSPNDLPPFDPMSPAYGKFNLVCVEAGMRIWEVYSHLDKLEDSRSIAKHFHFGNYKGPWAMPTLGGAGGQTLAGAFSTGTHGGDVRLPPIVDAVAAIHLVGAQGKQYWIEEEVAPGVPMIDEQKLRALYGDIEVIRDAEALRAAIVAVGRMGAIYSAVLRVVRQFALLEERSSTNWNDVRQWIGKPWNPHFNHHFVQVVVNPNGQPDDMHQHTAYVSFRDAMPLAAAGTPPKGREERGILGQTAGAKPGLQDSSDFTNNLCAGVFPVELAVGNIISTLEVLRAAAYLAAAQALAILISPIPVPPLKAAAAAALAAAYLVIKVTTDLIDALSALYSGLSDTLGEGLMQAGNWCADNDKLEYLRIINKTILENQLKDVSITAISYGIMDTTNYQDTYCTPSGDSLEVFFDASSISSARIIEFVDYLLARVAEIENGFATGQRLAIGGWVALRFMASTKALIGMQRWPNTCSIEVACPSGLKGTELFLADLEAAALASGGVLHWGQRNKSLGFQHVEKTYDPEPPNGSLFKWRQTLGRLTRNGRDVSFRTPYTELRGLEVVQPLAGSLRVFPEHAPTGSNITCEWNALDNPPATIAWLEVRGDDPSPAIELGALSGSIVIPMPRRLGQVVLRVSYKPYDRTRTNERVVEVRGFDDGDTWLFAPAPQCWPVAGQSRWRADINLHSQYISDNLYVAAVRCEIANLPATNATKWYVQTPGHPLLEFNQAGPEQVIAGTKPIFNRDWLIYVDEVGCVPPAPDFRIEFTLVSSP